MSASESNPQNQNMEPSSSVVTPQPFTEPGPPVGLHQMDPTKEQDLRPEAQEPETPAALNGSTDLVDQEDPDPKSPQTELHDDPVVTENSHETVTDTADQVPPVMEVQANVAESGSSSEPEEAVHVTDEETLPPQASATQKPADEVSEHLPEENSGISEPAELVLSAEEAREVDESEPIPEAQVPVPSWWHQHLTDVELRLSHDQEQMTALEQKHQEWCDHNARLADLIFNAAGPIKAQFAAAIRGLDTLPTPVAQVLSSRRKSLGIVESQVATLYALIFSKVLTVPANVPTFADPRQELEQVRGTMDLTLPQPPEDLLRRLKLMDSDRFSLLQEMKRTVQGVQSNHDGFVLRVIEILDSLQDGITHAQKAVSALEEELQKVAHQWIDDHPQGLCQTLLNLLKHSNVHPIMDLQPGDLIDFNEHQVEGGEPAEGLQDDTVLRQTKRGYLHKNDTLRTIRKVHVIAVNNTQG